jgi:integrase/recombinase XerD
MVKKLKNYEEWLDDFLSEKEGQGLSPASIKGMQFSLTKYLNFLGDDFMDKASYYKYLNSLEVAPTSKQHYARDVRCFLYWCQESELIPKFKVSLPKAQEPTPKIITEEQANALLFKRNEYYSEDRMYTVICLIFATGLRCRSIVNIKTEDVDFSNKNITIREAKGKKVLVLPMTEKLYKILKKYSQRWELGEYFFCADDGSQLKASGLQSCYKRYAKARNVPYGIHSLRHYYATEAVRHGMTPFALQRVLGHSSIDITMKYVNLVNGDLQNEMGKVDIL